MSTLLYILLGIVLLIIILGMIAPKTYEVNRSIVISKSLSEVFNYLKFLKNQEDWSPWAERDPNMKKTFSGTDGEVGFISAWESDHKQVGSGEQEITGIDENKEMRTQLRFLKPFKSQSDAYMRVADADGGTEVTWGFSGNNKFPMSIMMLFMNMEKAIGGDFEHGLAKLKTTLENK
ncbi:SRPBCC family protein [Aureibaculum conchae]|uniref:SRPBCC family protein n=1 Tax=Aureibaculum sp. 2308TA14-22 TaxID=3108392 RepID=UPI0033993815